MSRSFATNLERAAAVAPVLVALAERIEVDNHCEPTYLIAGYTGHDLGMLFNSVQSARRAVTELAEVEFEYETHVDNVDDPKATFHNWTGVLMGIRVQISAQTRPAQDGEQ
jgi:hypothetical protein